MIGQYDNPRHRDDLQGLRAIAVLLVALDHAGVGFLTGGYVGVDVFFVLSGYLITQLLLAEAARSGRVSLVNFYIRRARRILPAAALTLVATDVAAYYLLNQVRALQTMKDSVWAALFGRTSTMRARRPTISRRAEPPSPLLHFWSLSVEEQFYFFWPTVLALVLLGTLAGVRLRRGGGRFTGAAVGGLLVVSSLGAALSFAYAHRLVHLDPAGAYFSSIARAWELALGASLAIGIRWVTRVPASCPARRRLGRTRLHRCRGGGLYEQHAVPRHGGIAADLGAALVIAAGFANGEERRHAGRVLGLLPLRYVGDRSYTFYLWHWPFLVIAVDYEGHELPLAANLLLLAIGVCALDRHVPLTSRIRSGECGGNDLPVGLVLWPVSAAVVLGGRVRRHRIDREQRGRSRKPRECRHPAGDACRNVEPARPSGPARSDRERKGGAARSHDPVAARAVVTVSSSTNYQYPAGCVPRDADRPARRFATCPGRAAAPSSSPTPGHKTLVVFGDSHAEMWDPALLGDGKEGRLGHCPPVERGMPPRSSLRPLRFEFCPYPGASVRPGTRGR